MSGMSLQPVQQALYALLDGDATLGTLVTGVFDRVPEGTAFPYLVFEDADAKDASNVAQSAERVEQSISVYSREGGRKQALLILERVHSLLHQQSLTLAGGFSLVFLRIEQMQVEMQSDGLTWKGTARMQVQVTVA